MKKVLMIAYDYPPLGGGGVFRTLKFTKYLPQFGFQPYVLTVKNPMYTTKDPTLLKEIPPETKVFRTFSFEHRVLKAPRLLNINLKWFYIPDVNVGWLPTAIHKGTKIIKKENIDVIFATAPVWTSLLIGFILKKKTKKPLVIDFRDPWTSSPFIRYPTKLHGKIERKMEEKILQYADHITVAGSRIKSILTKRHLHIRSKITVITNGFDPDDFKNLKKQQANKFRITYTGSIYGLLTAKPFLLALKKLTKEKPNLRNKLEALFVGNYGRETPVLVKKLKLENVVKLIAYTSHKKTIEYMVNSHILLLLITVKGSLGKGILTGKLFEYLASRRPVLAIAPENGAAAKIIKKLKAGKTVSPNNIELIKETILKFYENWRQGKLNETTGDISQYDRKFLTQQLVKILERVMRRQKNNLRTQFTVKR